LIARGVSRSIAFSTSSGRRRMSSIVDFVPRSVSAKMSNGALLMPPAPLT